MASELASDTQLPGVEKPHVDDAPAEPVKVNGTHEPVETETQDDAPANRDAYAENNALPPTKDASLSLKETSAVPDSNPAGPTPTDDAAPSGIAPVADFIPKDAPNLSHPTPPPDQPLVSGEADVDTEMQDRETAEPTQDVSEPVAPVDSTAPVPAESAAPAESKVDDALPNGVASQGSEMMDVQPAPSASAPTEPVAQESPAPPSLVRPREDDADDEPAAKRTKVEEPESKFEPAEAPAESSAPAPAPVAAESTPVPPAETLDEKPSVPAAEAPVSSTEQAASITAQPPAPASSSRQGRYSTEPITQHQKAYLLEKLKNTKKTKHAIFFLEPVDIVKLNIPNYPDVIKEPMDLRTLETKLKENRYQSPQEFANDFHLIVDNAVKFNGPNHVVSQAGNNMRAYAERYLENMPKADQAPPKKAKKASPAPKQAPPRREQRPQPPPPAPAPERSSIGETFALQADGTPQIRRDSQTKRPARAIKPPANREVTYPKPKRKEAQAELKFCEHVLDELRSPKYGQLNHVFLMPVDPVALNIPHYRQIIKQPMDLSTMAQKLKQGQYSSAKEFEKDFKLMISNCLDFNPPGNTVRDMGIQFRREFEQIWNGKAGWERAHKQKSERTSSGSDESAEESEEDDEPEDAAQATIAALSKQLAEMQNQIAMMGQGGKPPKSKKVKDASKSVSKKKSAPAPLPKPSKAAPAPKAKPKKQRPVTYDEKQEISTAVEKMDGSQIEKLTSIITENCEKYRNMGDEMELEIDDLPDDVQRLLLKHVRSIFGNPNRAARAASPDDLAAADDDDFEPSHRARAAESKRKKHKPMGKKEQQDSINNLRNQLAAFSGNQASGSESPTSASFAAAGPGEESSGDESESEEE